MRHIVFRNGAMTFRPDYMKLGEVREKLGNPLTLALTATATKEVIQDMVGSLKLDNCKKIVYSVDRPNIAISVNRVENHQDKWESLHRYVQSLRDLESFISQVKRWRSRLHNY